MQEYDFDTPIDDNTGFDIWGKIGEVEMLGVDCSDILIRFFKSPGDYESSVSVVICSDERVARYPGRDIVRISNNMATCDADNAAFRACYERLSEMFKLSTVYDCGWANPEIIEDVSEYNAKAEYIFSL